MTNNLLLGIWRHLFPIPSAIWQNEVAQSAKQNQARLAFMTPEHHRIRNLVVRELPRVGAPLVSTLMVNFEKLKDLSIIDAF